MVKISIKSDKVTPSGGVFFPLWMCFPTAEPSPTIRGVNRPMPGGYKLHAGDPVDSLDGIRALTSQERSMIQTFPKDFKFTGTKTSTEQMIGNAVPVNLGKYIANAIMRYISEGCEDVVLLSCKS